MSLAELGALGEFLGFFAVLATLVYLAVQTKQTKDIATSQAARDVIADFQSVWRALGEDPEKTRLIRAAVSDWHALTPNEQMIAHVFLINLLTHLTTALKYEETLAQLKPFIRAWEDNVLGLLRCEGGRAWYATCEYLFASELRDRIAQRLAEPADLPPAWTAALPWWQVDAGELRD